MESRYSHNLLLLLLLSNNVIEQVHKIKDLGVYFDPRLKFDEHIDIKISKAIKVVGNN